MSWCSSRRTFLTTSATILAAPLWCNRLAAGADPAAPKLAFTADGKGYRFDTGELQGELRSQGKSLGLRPVVDKASGATLTHSMGLFSHYRLLDADTRYGGGAWDWDSQGRLLPDGAVQSSWLADQRHPFDMQAVYRWTTPHALDVTTRVTPHKDLRRFELFLASYFQGFDTSLAYVKACPETCGKAGFCEATKAAGPWQVFPRDEEALKLYADGRWKRPPSPVEWKPRPRLAAPLAMRRDAKTGLVALVMAPPEDCFAIATPFSGEGHRSLYLSLLGRDLKAGQTATARARLVIARGISDAQAVALYEAYGKESRK